MGVLHPNSTNYDHPDEPNLLDLHKSMQYNNIGEPVIRVHVDGINLEGDVIVNKVKLWDGTNDLTFDLPSNDGETAPWSLPTESHNMVFNGSTWDRMRGNTTDGVLTKLTNGSIAVTGTFWQATQPVSGTVTVQDGGSSITVDGTVNIGTMPEVEIKNDTGNPIPISKNTTTNSITNPIYVSNEGSQVVVGDMPAASLTAFDEPFAIGITPVIQADAMYGLDPDVWITTQLNNGTVTVTENTTWQVQSGTTAGGYARLATAAYMSYQPGQGSMFRWTAAFTTTDSESTDPYPTKNSLGIDNIVQNTGPIDREDGYSFGYSGSSANDASRKIGILHRRAGRAETRALTITTAPTGNQTATITLNGVAYTVAITATNGGGVNYTANQIALALKAQASPANLWDIEGCSGRVTFTYYSPGAKNGTYSFSSSGTGTLAVGTFSQLYAGATPSDTWTYVDDWDNQTIEFDPTKLNVFGVDLRWLGAGRVRFFMEDPATGKMVLVHTQRWSGQYLVPHVNKPSLRIVYRSGTTNLAVTPSRNVVVTGASVMTAIQGAITQTRPSQGWYDVNTTTKAKDIVHHLMSIQNPYVRNSSVNKSSIIVQSLTVALQGSDPSVIYVVKNGIGTASLLVFQNIPNSTTSMFCQYSNTETTTNLAVERISNIQTVGPNGTASFNLSDYNLMLNPGETVNVFISSSSTLTRTSTGLTWKVD